MQWAVEYQLRGLLRLYLFRAENEEGAKLYVQHMCELDNKQASPQREPVPFLDQRACARTITWPRERERRDVQSSVENTEKE